jgi:hypothetical protein
MVKCVPKIQLHSGVMIQQILDVKLSYRCAKRLFLYRTFLWTAQSKVNLAREITVANGEHTKSKIEAGSTTAVEQRCLRIVPFTCFG